MQSTGQKGSPVSKLMAPKASSEKNYRARQCLIDLVACDSTLLAKPARVRELILEAARRGGASAITDQFHSAETLTGTVITASGRLTVHAWPVEGLVTLDLVDSVSDNDESGAMDFAGIAEFLRDMLRAGDMSKTEIYRGEMRSIAPTDHFSDFQTEGAWLQ